MQSRDERLVHEYDPVARREYYLKTRELVGRKAGSDQLSGLARTSTTVSKAKPKPVIRTATERRKATEARLAELQGRLEKLQKVLAELVKKTGGSKKDSPSDNKDKKQKKPSELTAKQKSDAAKRSKEYRKKHPPSEQIKQITAKIKAIKAKIAQLRAEAKIPEKKPQKKSELRPESLSSLPTRK